MFALADQVEPVTSQHHHLPALRGPSAQQRSIRLPPQATQSGMQMHHLLRQLWTLIKAKQKHPGREDDSCHDLLYRSPAGAVAGCSIFLYLIMYSENDTKKFSCS